MISTVDYDNMGASEFDRMAVNDGHAGESAARTEFMAKYVDTDEPLAA